uniref:Uncharacterized protein n=1 Tax=Oryza nivara TaxID=4536 RepID=A0A0E0HNM6_ORYNI
MDERGAGTASHGERHSSDLDEGTTPPPPRGFASGWWLGAVEKGMRRKREREREMTASTQQCVAAVAAGRGRQRVDRTLYRTAAQVVAAASGWIEVTAAVRCGGIAVGCVASGEAKGHHRRYGSVRSISAVAAPPALARRCRSSRLARCRIRDRDSAPLSERDEEDMLTVGPTPTSMQGTAAAATAPAAGDDGALRTRGVRRRRRLPRADGGGSGSPRAQRQWRRRLVREVRGGSGGGGSPHSSSGDGGDGSCARREAAAAAVALRTRSGDGGDSSCVRRDSRERGWMGMGVVVGPTFGQ